MDEPFCFVAGTTGYDYTTMVMPEDAAAQARNAWASIENALVDVGFKLADIVRATYYVVNPADAAALLDVCGERLSAVRPASTLIVVAGLFKPEMKLKIQVTALRRDR